ncbi:MAG: Rne/Rng family ribonuclease, partial [Armatimonadota bacterium]
MSKEIIVNVDSRETRVAIIESGKLVELMVEREERVVGSIYKCKVANVLSGMDAAFVDIGLDRNAFLYVGDVLPEMDDEFPSARREAGRAVKIKDVLKPGQELLVQVVKGPRGTKGARVSTRISLPGRYLVLMPEADNIGVSRKIEAEGERERLKRIGENIRPLGFGLIVRTEAESRSEAELRQDLEFLLRMWGQIQEKAAKVSAPGLVHQDLSLIYKTIRDAFGSDVSKMIIDSPVDYEKAVELIELISPKMRSRLHLYDESEPIFERYSIESEIESLLRRKVWLKSGGHVTFDSTEALTAIDVNTGKFIGSTSLSDTILKTNLDAVVEIARQLRLRDIGGIIVIDFIDMASAKDRQKVVSALEKELHKDRTRTKICHISPLGLVEMTRKRTGETLTELVTEPCPYCQGRGRVES